MLPDVFLYLLFIFSTFPSDHQWNTRFIFQNEYGLADIQQVLPLNYSAYIKKECFRQLVFCSQLFFFLHTCLFGKYRVTALVANRYFFFRNIVQLDNIIFGLKADRHYLIGMSAGITEFFPVDLYIDGVVLIRVALMYEVMNSYNGRNAGSLYPDWDLMAYAMIYIDL